MDLTQWTAEDINMYSDASKSLKFGGLGAWCGDQWMAAPWDYDFLQIHQPSIAYLELFAVTAAVLKWIYKFKNKRICLYCDNEGAMRMINNGSSRCKNCMVLIRFITLEGLAHNIRITARYVNTKKNIMADALSRAEFKRFWRHAPETMAKLPCAVPTEIWPMSKIWIK